MRLALLGLLLLSLSCREGRLVSVPPCEPDNDPQEICDGRDNDCDGAVDGLLQNCSTSCGSGIERCTNGRWVGCSARVPSPEVCDGKDNDCDGTYDNNIPTSPCYPRDPKELENGICHWGTQRCVYGKFQCVNYQGPELETCNGLDDNCDGEADEGAGGSPLDVIFAVDYSGSMAPVISSLIAVTSMWANKYAQRQDLRFSLVGIPRPDPAGDCRTTIMTGFLSPGDFAIELAKYPSAIGGGIEPQLDAIYWAAIPQNPLGFQWRPGSNHAIIVYTDEMPQSYGNPTTVTEQMAWDAAVQNVLRVYVFSSDASWSRWSPRPFTNLEPELDKVIEQAACR